MVRLLNRWKRNPYIRAGALVTGLVTSLTGTLAAVGQLPASLSGLQCAVWFGDASARLREQSDTKHISLYWQSDDDNTPWPAAIKTVDVNGSQVAMHYAYNDPPGEASGELLGELKRKPWAYWIHTYVGKWEDWDDEAHTKRAKGSFNFTFRDCALSEASGSYTKYNEKTRTDLRQGFMTIKVTSSVPPR